MSKKAFADLTERLDRAVHEKAFYQTSFDWARTRINQLEHERAQLLQAAIGVNVRVPEIQMPQESKKDEALKQIGRDVGMFDDMGDDLAATMGIQAKSAFEGE